MTRDEAIQFYTKKRTKARSKHSRLAYYNILDMLNSAGSIDHAAELIEAVSKKSDNPERRAIYRKALREVRI